MTLLAKLSGKNFVTLKQVLHTLLNTIDNNPTFTSNKMLSFQLESLVKKSANKKIQVMHDFVTSHVFTSKRFVLFSLKLFKSEHNFTILWRREAREKRTARSGYRLHTSVFLTGK